jgi:hypothetical protein
MEFLVVFRILESSFPVEISTVSSAFHLDEGPPFAGGTNS